MIHLLGKSKIKLKHVLLPLLPQGMLAGVCLELAKKSSCLQVWEMFCC